MRFLKLLLIFSFLFNIPFASFPELENPLSPDYFSRANRSAHSLILLEQLTTTTVKRVVTKYFALLPDNYAPALKAYSQTKPASATFSHQDLLTLRCLRARAPPV